MAVFKCKMCGGALEIGENQSIATCEFCGTQQTLPKFDDERKVTLFTRANHLRFNCEFDKAAGVYESIVTEFPDEAEAYWGLVLCKYGIEYVDDSTGKKIPTCHRTLPTSIMDDEDFSSACDYADMSSKCIYREESKAIDKIQKKILEIASTEKPYDIFICYKETDEDTGARTEDSSIAQDIYTELIKEGYKVFFSRVTLREVAGTEYEPYIYAALSSAKVMLAIGTKFEYYDAVWVKNEWSRFISMIGDDSSKVLIPCYRNMDAYDMPKEFKNMQALDMGDVTFFASLTANINRLLPKEKVAVKETVVVNSGNTAIEPLLKRAFMFLEDGNWKSADEYCEKVLDIAPECAEAYLGKLMVEIEVNKREHLKDAAEPFDDNINYQKCVRYGDDDLKAEVKAYIDYINTRNENARIVEIYNRAKKLMDDGTRDSFKDAAKLFESIEEYKDSSSLIKECMEKSEEARLFDIYTRAKDAMSSCSYQRAINFFESIGDYKDSLQLAEKCKELDEEDRLKRERKAEEAREYTAAQARRKKTIIAIASSVVAIIVVFAIVMNTIIIPNSKYNNAIELMEAGEYQEALSIFWSLDDFKDSEKYAFETMSKIVAKETISAGGSHIVALQSDGTVLATGNNEYGQCNVDDWSDIISISADGNHTVALKSNGTVLAVGNNDYGQCNVDNWTDIVAIATSNEHTIGLKSDGTVVAVGYKFGESDVSDWKDIVAISVGSSHIVGLKSDGTVIATGSNVCGQCNVSDWTDIAAISAGGYYTVGLKYDGTVIATDYIGDFYYGQCDVSGWTDIVAVSAGSARTVGLKSDGTVVTVGDDDECDVDDWTDIVAVSAGGYYTVGLKSDGTVVAVGDNYWGQCDVDEWTDIKIPNN